MFSNIAPGNRATLLRSMVISDHDLIVHNSAFVAANYELRSIGSIRSLDCATDDVHFVRRSIVLSVALLKNANELETIKGARYLINGTFLKEFARVAWYSLL